MPFAWDAIIMFLELTYKTAEETKCVLQSLSWTDFHESELDKASWLFEPNDRRNSDGCCRRLTPLLQCNADTCVADKLVSCCIESQYTDAFGNSPQAGTQSIFTCQLCPSMVQMACTTGPREPDWWAKIRHTACDPCDAVCMIKHVAVAIGCNMTCIQL